MKVYVYSVNVKVEGCKEKHHQHAVTEWLIREVLWNFKIQNISDNKQI